MPIRTQLETLRGGTPEQLQRDQRRLAELIGDSPNLVLVLRDLTDEHEPYLELIMAAQKAGLLNHQGQMILQLIYVKDETILTPGQRMDWFGGIPQVWGAMLDDNGLLVITHRDRNLGRLWIPSTEDPQDTFDTKLRLRLIPAAMGTFAPEEPTK